MMHGAGAEDSRLFKVAIAGDGLVGKTCLLNRYTKNQYSCVYQPPTIGTDIIYKEMVIEGKVVKLQFWDLSCQHVGSKEVTSNFFRGSAGVMICFSLIDNQSLSHVTDWRQRSLSLIPEETPCVLVGTKCDLRSLPQENWTFLCDCEDFDGWYQTSAKAGIGVNESFEGLIKLILEYDAKVKSDNMRNPEAAGNAILTNLNSNADNENEGTCFKR